ncbi:DUF1259 domain-containing protein [Virgibacillus senegalensis]|uniref:DUF1259 domain-containing protein n=1 Tax=Virgibacillus senegalensis TaxID=1499679 RepID=UPI00069DC8E3|nr:DUF1259 domain-containing protein [Virgibacillus senegalensis]
MHTFDTMCEQFAIILNGESKVNRESCSVSLQREFQVTVQGYPSSSVVPAVVGFESMDKRGNAICLAEIAVLQEEIPAFLFALTQQGLIVSALHNHWLFTNPVIMYVHIQSVESPIHFARKMSLAFSYLNSYPIA